MNELILSSMHWLAMAHGAATQSMPIVTAYDTLGEEGLTSSLEATRAKLMFLDAHLLKTLIKPLKKADYLEVIVYDKDEDLVKEDLDALLKAYPNLKIISFEQLRKAGAENPQDPVPPSPEDTLLYHVYVWIHGCSQGSNHKTQSDRWI
jgi:long-chain acyl-CoA synthetase